LEIKRAKPFENPQNEGCDKEFWDFGRKTLSNRGKWFVQLVFLAKMGMTVFFLKKNLNERLFNLGNVVY